MQLTCSAAEVKIRNGHSDELAGLLGVRSATSSAYMSFNNRNQLICHLICLSVISTLGQQMSIMLLRERETELKWYILHISVFLNTWSAYMRFPIDTRLCISQCNIQWSMLMEGRCAKFGVMVLKASFLDWWGGRSAKFSVMVLKASMLDWGGVDLPVDLPIWAVTVAMCNCHSWSLDAC